MKTPFSFHNILAADYRNFFSLSPVIFCSPCFCNIKMNPTLLVGNINISTYKVSVGSGVYRVICHCQEGGGLKLYFVDSNKNAMQRIKNKYVLRYTNSFCFAFFSYSPARVNVPKPLWLYLNECFSCINCLVEQSAVKVPTKYRMSLISHI